MIKNFDVIVVGGGPAGCATAFDLARANKQVAILERRKFPRIKPCGGALTAKALQAIRFSVKPVVRNIATNFVAGREFSVGKRFAWAHPVAALTVREELDHFVLKQVLDIGVSLVRVGRISSISESEDNVRVVTDEGILSAQFLVGADGASSTVRRLTQKDGARKFGFAIEGNIRDNSAHQPEMTFDFGVVPRGYGWIFPRGDHYNVGVYTYDSRFGLFPEQLRSYVKQKLGRKDIANIVGSPIGMWGWMSPPVADSRKIFLVGDAAGLCDPVLGEGIYYAIKSGQLAAASILEDLEGGRPAQIGFQKSMEMLRSDLRVAGRMALWFYRDLGIGCLALGSPLFRYALMKGYSLGVPLGNIPRQLITLPFRRIGRLRSIEAKG